MEEISLKYPSVCFTDFQEICGTVRLRDETGKQMDALTIFAYSIQYLKDHLLGVVCRGSPGLDERDVGWVITVPALWAESAKKFMRQAAQQVSRVLEAMFNLNGSFSSRSL